MAADVVKFTGAVDKAFKTFSTQEVQIAASELKGKNLRDAMQHMEKKFQHQLQRARDAFLQEFRNHSVVVECEVRKIREELTGRMEQKYGDRIGVLKQEAAEAAAVIQKLKDEVVQLRSAVATHEAAVASVLERSGLETKEALRLEIRYLKDQLVASRKDGDELITSLSLRDEHLVQQNKELSGLEAQIKRQAENFTDERRGHEAALAELRREMADQQESFKARIEGYEAAFAEYRRKAAAELQIQDILNRRKSEAIAALETERQLHIKARTKPTQRIGEAGPTERDFEFEVEAKCADYELEPARYRVDDMGMDIGWRDYHLKEFQFVPPVVSVQQPKFRIERLRQAAQRGATRLGARGPTASEISSDRSVPAATQTPRRPLSGPQLEVAATMLPAIGPGSRSGGLG